MLSRRLARASLEPVGLMSPLALLCFAAALVILSDAPAAVCTIHTRHTIAHLELNRYLLAGLVLACLAWTVVRTRGLVAPTTGAGLGIAAMGLAARGLIELAMTSFWAWPPSGVAADATPALMVDACLALGLFAYAVGLTVTAGACAFEWRVRRRGARTPPR